MTEAERKELEALESKYGAPTTTLSPEEAQELAQLESKFSPPAAAEAAPQERFSTPESSIQGMGQALTLGYLPKLQAGVMAALDPDLTYEQALPMMQKRAQDISEEDPIAHGVGQLAGSVAMPIPGFGAAKTVKGIGQIAKQAIKAAGTGAVIGGSAETGEKFLSPEDIDARLNNAAFGGVVGGGAQGLSSYLTSIPDKLGKLKKLLTVWQIGAGKGKAKELLKKNQIPKIENFLKEEKLLRPGKTFENVLERSSEVVDETGRKIGETYDDILKKAGDTPITPADALKVQAAKPNANQMADEFLAEQTEKLTGKAGGKQAVSQIENELQNLRALGDDPSITQLLEYRKSLDDNIRYNKLYSEAPTAQKSLRDLRTNVQNKIDNLAKTLDEVYKTKHTNLLKQLNEKYSAAKTVKDIAQDKMAGETARSGLGLLETITGTGYAASQIAQGEDPLKALGKGLLVGAGTRATRTYGPGAAYQAARGAQALSRPISKGFQNLPKQTLYTPWLTMPTGPQEEPYGY